MMQKYLIRLSPGILSSIVIIAILWLTLAPDPLPDNDISLFPGADKIVHALMFGTLAFTLALDKELYKQRLYEQTRRMPRDRGRRPLLLIAVAATLFGGLIELLQAAMNLGRGCELMDFVADAAGAFSGVAVSPLLITLLLRR